MCILVDENTRVIIQGITGKVGEFQTRVMIEYGTKIVAGVTPGKGGQKINNIPVYDLVGDAVNNHGGDASILFVPGPYAADAAIEALDAGLKLVIITAEGVPIRDMMKVIHYANDKRAKILGPDTAGIISPGKSKVGVHPHRLFKEGNIGIVSKSGALSYEVSKTLCDSGLAQSTVVGIGGGPLWGLTQADIIELFERDDDTEGIILLGEIGGSMEEEAAAYIKKSVEKPVVALIVGRHAPEGKRMGHAGAIISKHRGRAEDKVKALEAANVNIVKEPRAIPTILKKMI